MFIRRFLAKCVNKKLSYFRTSPMEDFILESSVIPASHILRNIPGYGRHRVLLAEFKGRIRFNQHCKQHRRVPWLKPRSRVRTKSTRHQPLGKHSEIVLSLLGYRAKSVWSAFSSFFFFFLFFREPPRGRDERHTRWVYTKAEERVDRVKIRLAPTIAGFAKAAARC